MEMKSLSLQIIVTDFQLDNNYNKQITILHNYVLNHLLGLELWDNLGYNNPTTADLDHSNQIQSLPCGK